jgi:prolyl 4-hydroxylase
MPSYLDELNHKNIVCVDAFISARECKFILEELEFVYWQSSSVVKRAGARGYQYFIGASRKSLTAQQDWFSQELNDKLAEIEHKLSELFDTKTAHLENWQATRYGDGDKFDYHVDCGLWKRAKGGERRRSILLFLDTPRKGGATHFRALNLKIKARTGRLLVWNNLLPNGNCNYNMIHSGQAVLEGTKTTLVTWERERSHRRKKAK